MPTRREARAASGVVLVVGATLSAISVVRGFDGKTFLGRPLGADFAEFYTTGKILNRYAPARIYNPKFFTNQLHSTLSTIPESETQVFAYPPFVASLFRPFALLPYAWAYLAWLGFSAALFMAGLAVLFRTFHFHAADYGTGFLLAVSFAPFLFETWIGGQTSVIAFFIWVLFFRCLEGDRHLLAGLVLALCLFKPTLVALPALMLLAGRCWRVIGGLLAGAIAVSLLSLATVGMEGCRGWFRMLALIMAGKGGEGWRQAKYVDMMAFFHLLLPNAPAVVVSLALGAAAVIWLVRAWWRSNSSRINRPLWAATLCLSLVVSPYIPIYDTTLLVCAVALLGPEWRESAGWLVALYVIPWVTQPFAQFLHVQLMTLVLTGFGIWVMKKLVERSLPSPRPARTGDGSMVT